MIERGYDLHLLCPPEAKIYSVAKKNHLPVTPLPIARKKSGGLLAIRNWLRNNPVDVVITHSSTDSWLTAVACKTLANPPQIIRLRHVSAPTGNDFPTRWLYNKACKHIVTTGEYIRKQLIQNNGTSADRITSIATGIDLNRFVPGDKRAARQKLGLSESDHIIGIVATLRSWKGHLYLVEAFAQLQQLPGLRLLLVGEGPWREKIEMKVAERSLEDKVTFTGNQEDPVPWFQALDTFVLPSYANEGIPQALMQAMACGLPVIGGRVGGIPEIVEEDKTGLLFEPKNIPALVSAMERFINDHSLAAEMGSAANHVAQERFGVEIMLDKMDVIINRVLEKTG